MIEQQLSDLQALSYLTNYFCIQIIEVRHNSKKYNFSFDYLLIGFSKLTLIKIKKMGTCVSQSSQRQAKSFSIIPQDTTSLKDALLPTLAFYVLISDIKIKRCTYDFISLKFKLHGIHQFDTPIRQIDRGSRAYWKLSHVFQFYMTQYQLRNQFLEIEAYDKHNKMVGVLKLNMFVLWIGPYHLDFKFQMPESQSCRISLNFKISQGINLIINNISTQMIPNQATFLEDKFTFSIQAIIGQQLQASVCPYIVQIKDSIGNIKQNKSTVNIYFVTNDKIIWSRTQQQQLPKFDKEIAFYEIYSSSLHILFFRVLPGLQQKSELRYEPQSQCYISLAKLMTLDYTIRKDTDTNISYYQRNIQLVQKTWLHGKQMGKVKIAFHFSMQSHLKQMQACVRTEKGILTSSPVFSLGTHNCQEIQALKQLNDDIQKEFIHLDRNVEKRSNTIMVKQNILRICNLLIKQLALLEKSSKQSILFYEYKNEMQLYKGQRFLIDLAFKASTFIHQDNPDICEICWNILTVILKRGQFQLSHMGFSKEDKANIEKNDISSNLRVKIDTNLKYQELLNHLLRQTLSLLVYKGEEAEQIFAQSFCSYAYFRIPSFRENILSVISKQDDPQIRQWRGTQVNLYEDLSESEKGNEFFQLLFDWENNFYKPLMGEQKYKIHNTQLQSILLQNQWKNRLGKRSGAFFTFLQNLMKQIEYVSVVSKYIKWHQMPGYNRLLHAFLVEMKKNKIKNYTQRFKKCCTKLLLNQKLLNIFVVILFNKTNLNEPQTVQVTFQMIDNFLSIIRKNVRTIPGTFDYKYLLGGIKTVLDSQQSYSICQVLLLIYNHLSIFSNQFGLQLAFYLLSKPFFRFFFNWSYNLRYVFHTLVFMKISKIQQGSSQVISQKTIQQGNYIANIKTSIHQRYNALMRIIQKQIYQVNLQNNHNSFYQKCLYKKMRSRLQEKRKKPKVKEQDYSISSIHDIPLPSILSTKSLSAKGQMINPYNMIYFKQEDMNIISPKDTELSYAKQAFSQYSILVQQISKNIKLDPKFSPDMKVKKIIDEKQLSPSIADQW